MLNELKRFIKECDCTPVKTTLKGDAAAAAIQEGIEYFRTHKNNFAVDERALRSAVRGLTTIAGMKEHVLPSAQAEQALSVIGPWVERQLLASAVSTYAYLFAQGRTNRHWPDARRQAAELACEFFNIP